MKRDSRKPITGGHARADYSPVNQGWIIQHFGVLRGVVNTRAEAESRVWQLEASER